MLVQLNYTELVINMGLISNGTTLLDAGAIDSGVATGAMTLIKTLTASSSGTLSFVDGASSVVLDGTYKEYIFKIFNVHPSESADFAFNLSIDTGSNYNVAKTTAAFFSYNSEDDSGQAGPQIDTSDDLANGTGFQKLNVSSTWGTPSNDQGLSGQLHLFDPSNTTFVKHFLARTNLTVEYSLDSHVNGYANTTSAVDAVQFKFESGNIDSGIIKMYGIK